MSWLDRELSRPCFLTQRVEDKGESARHFRPCLFTLGVIGSPSLCSYDPSTGSG